MPYAQPLTGWAFVKDLAARSGASLATTGWDTGSVFAAVATTGTCCRPRNELGGRLGGRGGAVSSYGSRWRSPWG